jgi:integrase
MGTIYKRGQTYWIKYYHDSKPIYESSRSKLKMVAKSLLQQREGDISQGKVPGVYFDKVTFDELAEDFLRDYRINKRKSIQQAEIIVKHLKRHFGGFRVCKINSLEINAYVQKRIDDGMSNGTINRELAGLRRMLNIGANMTPPKVDRVPRFSKLEENNVRKGFFEHDDFLKFRDKLPDHFKGFVTFAYKTGWRKSEIIGLTWNQVDRLHGIVRLEPGETKNDEGRTVYLDDELKEIFQIQWEKRKESQRVVHYVFPNRRGTGKIKDFRDAWDRAFKRVGLERKLFHDFRRTAVRNMVRSGINERVAMMISGHKTRAVFDRYNIVSDTDLREAALKQEKYLNG